MFELVFSKVFDEDIDACYDYIKDTLESPMAAKNLMNELSSKLIYLEEKPYSRPLVQDKFLASFGIRSIRVKNYIVFYIISFIGSSFRIFIQSLLPYINLKIFTFFLSFSSSMI